MSDAAALIKAGIAQLAQAGVADPERDVMRLLAVACGGRYLRGDAVSDRQAAAFSAMIARRGTREPVSHITGWRAFWKHEFAVTPDVLDPRPETELLVELALTQPFQKVLDLGTGSGCIVISLLAARAQARGVGTDVSEAALLVAGQNAARIGVADRLILPLSDWYRDIGGRFDLIVSNPPYIALDEMADLSPEVRGFEPHMALTDGGDGLNAYRAITAGARDHLTPGGRILLEIGPTQGAAVRALLAAAGLETIKIHPDLDGRDRVVSAIAGP